MPLYLVKLFVYVLCFHKLRSVYHLFQSSNSCNHDEIDGHCVSAGLYSVRAPNCTRLSALSIIMDIEKASVESLIVVQDHLSHENGAHGVDEK